MSFLNYVKQNLTTLPYFVGKPISFVPYNLRPGLGSIYRQRQREIAGLSKSSVQDKKSFIYERVKNIAVYASAEIPFYKDLYRGCDVQPVKFKDFSDLANLPIITKDDLQKVSLEYRSSQRKGRSIVNTGGSSGHPLEFYIEPSSIGHEWAHMHKIWSKVTFKQSDLKIVFGGRSDVKDIVQYDSARHQLNVDLYSGWQAIADALLKVFGKYHPKYLHGYPSSIFDFIIWLEENSHPLLPILSQKISGIFLGSEFPSPQIRSTVEELLNCDSVSWYGHTERAVLAYEKEQHGVYHPFVTYGYSEVSDDNHLIATSYYNKSSPLIRYDTGDLIRPNMQNGLLTSFEISQGREGEYILDAKGNKIFLTALIFGRHHGLFDQAQHIQISQIEKGKATVLVTPRNSLTSEKANKLFDKDNVEIQFDFKIIEQPMRTAAGKVPLLVKNID